MKKKKIDPRIVMLVAKAKSDPAFIVQLEELHAEMFPGEKLKDTLVWFEALISSDPEFINGIIEENGLFRFEDPDPVQERLEFVVGGMIAEVASELHRLFAKGSPPHIGAAVIAQRAREIIFKIDNLRELNRTQRSQKCRPNHNETQH